MQRRALSHALLFLSAAVVGVADEAPQHLPASAGVSMSPNVPLDQLRFVYVHEGKYFVEIACETDAARDFLLEVYGDWESMPFGESLPEDRQADARKLFDTPQDTDYVVVLPFQERVVTAKVDALAAYHEGGGGRFGIWGLLDLEGPARNRWLNTEGVAIRSDAEPSMKSAPTLPTNDAMRGSISEVVSQRPEAAGAQVLDAIALPDSPRILATLRVEESDVLFALSEHEDKLELEVLDDFWKHGGLPLEERPGEFCGAMRDSRVAILPDVNGDGVSELLISSEVSYLIDPAERHPDAGHMHIVQTTYFGP